MDNRMRGLVVFLIISLLLPVSVQAQTGASANLSHPNTEDFPHIETFLDVRDADGNFVHGLQASHIRIIENSIPVLITGSQEIRPGVQVAIALDPGPSFGVRNSQAVSRYDNVKEVLQNWALSRQGTTLDDWSLLITNGTEISHVSDPLKWLMALDKDQVDPRSSTSSLDTLFRAINIAADSAVRPSMGRTVLYITSPPAAETISSLENLAAQAAQNNITINIWVVSAPGSPQNQSMNQLMELAESSGGKFFVYTGEEPLPDPEDYLEPLRPTYHLTYLSQVTHGGTHQVVAQVQIGGEQIATSPQSFEIDIQPPQPAFISPPIHIHRQPPSDFDDQGGNEEISTQNYLPDRQDLQVVFDFPDERIRPMVESTLFVDGVVIDKHTKPPFDQFVWRLDDYTSDGSHNLQVQVKDVLGLVGASAEIPVQITIEHPSSSSWLTIQQNIPILIGLAVLVAGAALLLVLVLGGRLRPRTLSLRMYRRRKSDPVTQPVNVKGETTSRRLTKWVDRLHWPQRHAAPKAHAFLSRISDTDHLTIAPPSPILSNETIIGCDPNHADLVLDDLSIEKLHARLTRNDDGSFHLADEGSIAGTWINYSPVSQEGSKLEHGDLVHIGRTGFRFTLRKPAVVRKPVVTTETEPGASAEEIADDLG